MNHRLCWMAFALLILLPATSHADIFRWDNGQLIPGTEGITPGPGVELNNRQLQYARLPHTDLTSANFASSDLTQASFNGSMLDGANLSGAMLSNARFMSASLINADLSGANLMGETQLDYSNLTNADLSATNLTNANFYRTNLHGTKLSGATITGASFVEVSGLAPEQFYSTASYQAKDLRGMLFIGNDFTDWDFSRQNLTGSWLHRCLLANADLRDTDLTNAELKSANLTGANFEDSIINGTDLEHTTSSGFTKEQLYSTASYQAKDLRRVRLFGNDLTGWDFRGQNLSGAVLQNTNLMNADLTGAIVEDTSFGGSDLGSLTKEQFYSTASYRAKVLRGVAFVYSDLSGWNFSGQNLHGVTFFNGNLAQADFTDAVLNGVWFGSSISKEQLYSTANYQAKDLTGVFLGGIRVYFNFVSNLAGWDFHGQNLSKTHLSHSILASADLRSANLPELTDVDLTGADIRGAYGFNLTDGVTRNLIRPDGTIKGLDLATSETLLVRDDDPVPAAAPQAWLSPRPPIAVKIEDRMKLADSSVLQMCFEADPWDSLISFAPGIPVQLGGTLELTFAIDVDVATQVGRTLRIFDWTGVAPAGRFAIQSPYDWDTSQLYSTGEITLRAVPEPSAASIVLATLIVFAASRAPRRRLLS